MENHLECDGQCPQCLQKEVSSLLYENSTGGYWECPKCQLQLQMLDPNYLGILEERGKGKLKNIAYDIHKWGNRVLLRRPQFPGDDCLIKNINELNDYLSQIKNKNDLNHLNFK